MPYFTSTGGYVTEDSISKFARKCCNWVLDLFYFFNLEKIVQGSEAEKARV